MRNPLLNPIFQHIAFTIEIAMDRDHAESAGYYMSKRMLSWEDLPKGKGKFGAKYSSATFQLRARLSILKEVGSGKYTTLDAARTALLANQNGVMDNLLC